MVDNTIDSLVSALKEHSSFDEADQLYLQEATLLSKRLQKPQDLDDAVYLLKTFSKNSDVDEDSYSLASATAATMQALARFNRSVNDAQRLISTYSSKINQDVSALELQTVVIRTLEAIDASAMPIGTVENLIIAYAKSDYEESSSSMQDAVCTTLQTLHRTGRSMDEAIALANSYYDASSEQESATAISSGVCSTLDLLKMTSFDASAAALLVSSYKEASTSDREDIAHMSAAVCRTLTVLHESNKPVDDAKKIIDAYSSCDDLCVHSLSVVAAESIRAMAASNVSSADVSAIIKSFSSLDITEFEISNIANDILHSEFLSSRKVEDISKLVDAYSGVEESYDLLKPALVTTLKAIDRVRAQPSDVVLVMNVYSSLTDSLSELQEAVCKTLSDVPAEELSSHAMIAETYYRKSNPSSIDELSSLTQMTLNAIRATKNSADDVKTVVTAFSALYPDIDNHQLADITCRALEYAQRYGLQAIDLSEKLDSQYRKHFFVDDVSHSQRINHVNTNYSGIRRWFALRSLNKQYKDVHSVRTKKSPLSPDELLTAVIVSGQGV